MISSSLTNRLCMLLLACGLLAATRPAMAADQAAVAPAAGSAAVRMDADGHYLWRCVQTVGADAAHLAVRVNGLWRQVANLTRPVADLCALDGKLHVFFADGSYALYDARSGDAGVGRLWPRRFQALRPLAACTSPVAADQGVRVPDSIFLLLGPASAGKTAATAKNAEDASPPAPHSDKTADTPSLVLLEQRGQRWTDQAIELPGSLDTDERVLLESTGPGELAALVCTAEGWPRTLYLVRDGKARRIDRVESPGVAYRIASSTSTGEDFLLYGGGGAEALGDASATMPATATATDADANADGAAGAVPPAGWFMRLVVDAGADRAGFSEPVALSYEGRGIDLSPAGGGAACMHAGGVASLIYPTTEGWRQATATIANGVVTRPEPVEIGVDQLDADAQTQNLIQVFMLVCIAVTAAAVLSRTRENTGPFTLPQGIAPAFFPKRMLAAALELMGAIFVTTQFSGLEMDMTLDMIMEAGRGHSDLTPTATKLTLISWGVYVVYCTISESLWATTPVKLAFGMQVCGSNGRRPSLKSVIIRNVMKPLEMITPAVPLFLLFPLFTRNSQRAGDMLASCCVVNRPRGLPVGDEAPDATPDEASNVMETPRESGQDRPDEPQAGQGRQDDDASDDR